jgi:hypothetical protein
MPPGRKDGFPGWPGCRPGAWRPRAIRARDGRRPGIIQRGPGSVTSWWSGPVQSRSPGRRGVRLRRRVRSQFRRYAE